MTQKTFTLDGKEVQKKHIVHLCDAAHHEAAKAAAYIYITEYMGDPNEDASVEDMFPTELVLDGETYYMCSMTCLCLDKSALQTFYTENPQEDNPNTILSLEDDYMNYGFCSIEATREEFLADSGMEIV